MPETKSGIPGTVFISAPVVQIEPLRKVLPSSTLRGRRQLLSMVCLFYALLFIAVAALLNRLPLEEIIGPEKLYWLEATDLRAVPFAAIIAVLGLLGLFQFKARTSKWWSPDRLSWWAMIVFFVQAACILVSLSFLNSGPVPLANLNYALMAAQVVLMNIWTSGYHEEWAGLLVLHLRIRFFSEGLYTSGR